MRHFRLLWLYFRTSVLGELAYRVNFAVQLLESLVELGTALTGLAVVFSHTATIGGWRPDEVIALVGVFFLMGGVIRLMIQPSMEWLTESVRDGSLDFTLAKPEDSQFLASIQRVEIWKVMDIALGFGVLAVALARMGARVGIRDALGFAAASLTGGVIVYSFWIILASSAFWLVRVENILMIFQSMYEAGRWPVSLYPGWLRFALTYVIPVAFVTTVPAQALAGRLTWRTLVGSLAVAAALFALSRFVWKLGLRRYSGASS